MNTLNIATAPKEAIVREICACFLESVDTYRAVPSIQILKGVGYQTLLSGIQFLGANSVLLSEKNSPEATVQESITALHKANVPFMIYVVPPASEESISILADRFRLTAGKRMPAMVANLDACKVDVPLPSGVILKVVENELDLSAWCGIFKRVFDWPNEAIQLLAEAWRQGDEWEFYLAIKNGTSVGCSSNFFGSRMSGIYSEGVVTEARRQGIGAALVRLCMKRAGERGFKSSMLFASLDGIGVYRKCGYSDSFDMPVFLSR